MKTHDFIIPQEMLQKLHGCILLRASLCTIYRPVCKPKTCILTERPDTICKICINSLSNWILGLFFYCLALFKVFFFFAGHGLGNVYRVRYDRCLYCKSRNNNKLKVKTVPYLFGLFTIRYFSLMPGRSESVSNALLQPLCFYRPM